MDSEEEIINQWNSDFVINTVIKKRYDVLQRLVNTGRKEFFTDDDLWQVMNQHDFTAVKILLPMYEKIPKYLVYAADVSSLEIVQLLLDEGFVAKILVLYLMYFNNVIRENLLLILRYEHPEMTLTDFLVQNEYFNEASEEMDKYPITIINNQALRYAIFAKNFKLMKTLLERGNFDKSDIQIILSAIDLHAIYIKALLEAGFSADSDDQILRSKLLVKLLSRLFERFLLFIGRVDLTSKIIFEDKLITPIEYVIRYSNVNFLRAIVNAGVDPNKVEVDEINDPLILLAASIAKFDMVYFLLPNTRYLNRVDIRELNLVSYTLCYKDENVELLQELIAHGAHLDHLTSLHLDNEIVSLPPLLLAAERRKMRSIEILVEHGCDINFTLGNLNVFTLCSAEHAVKILQLGFSAVWRSDIKYTAGIWAATRNWNRDIQLACIKYLPKQINKCGSVSFLTATADVIVAKELLAAGADINLGTNAFDYSFANNHPDDKLLLLLEKGVRPMIDYSNSGFNEIIYKALVFWNLPMEERQKYPIKKIVQLCPMYREELALLALQNRSMTLTMLPNELLQEIAQYIESDMLGDD